MLRCSLGQDFWYPWLPGSGIQNEARSCGRKVAERFLQYSLLLLASFLLVIPSGCSTVGRVGRRLGLGESSLYFMNISRPFVTKSTFDPRSMLSWLLKTI